MAYITPKYSDMDTCRYTGIKRYPTSTNPLDPPGNWEDFGQCPNCTGVTKILMKRTGYGEVSYQPMPIRHDGIPFQPPRFNYDREGAVISEQKLHGAVSTEPGDTNIQIQRPQYVTLPEEDASVREKTAWRCSHCGYEFTEDEQLTTTPPATAPTSIVIKKNSEAGFLKTIEFEMQTSTAIQKDVLWYELVFVQAPNTAIGPALMSFPVDKSHRGDNNEPVRNVKYKMEYNFNDFIPIPPGLTIGVVPVNYNGRGPAIT